MRNLLIAISDPIAMGFYIELFRELGVEIEPAPTLTEMIQAAEAMQPSLVVLDPVFPTFEETEAAARVSERFSAVRPPVRLLPIGPLEVRKTATFAPDTAVLNFHNSLAESLISGIGVRPGGMLGPADIARARRLPEATVDAFQTTRNLSRQLLRSPRDSKLLYQVFYHAHVTAHRALLSQLAPAASLASAIEGLLYSWLKMPERIESSSLQTLSQAIDMLDPLLAPENQGALRPASQCRVLAIDDDKFCCDTLDIGLSRFNLIVDSAYAMPQAMAKLHRTKFDLVLLDVSFPYSSGFEICERIRATPDHKQTPVLFLTGLPTFQNRVQSNLSGGNDFLSKPVSLQELPAKVLTWIYRFQLGLTHVPPTPPPPPLKPTLSNPGT